MNQQQMERFIGPRGEHHHGGAGDAGCFPTCPVWSWDLRARQLQAHMLDQKIELLEWAQAGAAENSEELFAKAIDEAKSQRAKLGL